MRHLHIVMDCAICNDGSCWCPACGACQHKAHEPECRESWRALILSYNSK